MTISLKFNVIFYFQYELLRLMLSDSPDERPTTYGVRARLPLKQEPVEENLHFELPSKNFPQKNNSTLDYADSES